MSWTNALKLQYLANYWSQGLDFDIPTYSTRGNVAIFEFKVKCQGHTHSANALDTQSHKYWS